MSEPDPHLLRELAAMQNIVNERHAAFIEHRNFWNGGPPPPPTRVQRFRNRWFWRIRAARTRGALLIAPWLDNY